MTLGQNKGVMTIRKMTLGVITFRIMTLNNMGLSKEYLRGKYHCTIDLLFVWFGISCMTANNFCFLFAKQTNPNKSNRWSAVQ